MDYLVIGADGQEYGPANVETLRQWVADNRVSPDTNLKEFQSGRVLRAADVEALFPRTTVNAPPTVQPPAAGNPYASPPTYYPRQPSAPVYSSSGNADIAWAIGRSAAALIFFFLLNGIGVIFAIYGIVSAVRADQQGHRFGKVAIGISVATLVIILIGWFFRVQGRS